MQDATMRRKDCETMFELKPPHGWGLACGAGLACALWSSVAAAEAGRVELLANATVSGPGIRVGDLGRLREFSDEQERAALESLVLFESPAAGDRRIVFLDEIREALYSQGVNLGQVILGGSARVEVRRSAGSGVPTESVAADGGEPRPAGSGTLEAFLRSSIQKRFSNYAGRVEVRFSRTQAASRALSLRAPEFEFRLEDKGEARLGVASYAVQVIREGERVQTVHVLADSALIRKVAVAVRAINRGRTIERSDVGMSERRFTRLDRIGRSDVGQVVGQQARGFIEQGKMIGVRDVKAVPLVKRNELVTVWNRRGSVSVRTVGKALSSGSLGEEIEVKSERSGKRYTARITGLRTVELWGSEGATKVAMR